jgi:hypothetical protein
LWESEVAGTLLEQSHNFVIVNKEGMGVVALGSVPKQIFMDDKGNERLLHSLESCNYLKVEQDNHILYNCSKPDKTEIQVLEEFTNPSTNETSFQQIYNVRI